MTMMLRGPDSPADWLNSRGLRIAAQAWAIENFWRWFGDSKVVDGERGRPLVVYHGTYYAEGFTDAGFSYEAKGIGEYGDSDVGFFFGSSEAANNFANEGEGSAVLPVYLSLKNPKIVKGADFVWMLDEYLTDDWHQFKADAVRDGYDGVIVRTDATAKASVYHHQFQSDNWIAFSPEQIKSAIGNSGLFLPDSPDFTDTVAAADLLDDEELLRCGERIAL